MGMEPLHGENGGSCRHCTTMTLADMFRSLIPIILARVHSRVRSDTYGLFSMGLPGVPDNSDLWMHHLLTLVPSIGNLFVLSTTLLER